MSLPELPAEMENPKIPDNRIKLPLSKWPSRSIDLYTKREQVGEGTFGKVYKAEYHDPDNKTSPPLIVALKMIRMNNEKEGFPITALREINILKRLTHKNIIKLHEIVISKPKPQTQTRGDVYLVFEYMEHDFSGLFNMKMNFNIPSIKCIMTQILTGIDYLHKNNIIHRDIKSANILVNNKGEVKLGDFGLARIINPQNLKKYTNRVVTLWYRAPELLLGETQYGPAIDMWSIGCFFSELLTGVPPFRGKKELEQIEKIFEKCGTPNEQSWPGVTLLPHYADINMNIKTTFPYALKAFYADNNKVDNCCFDLLSKMLTLDPKKRISVKDAMEHPYFKYHKPNMCLPEELPKIEKDSHEYQARRGRNINECKQMINNLVSKGVVIGKGNYATHGQQSGQKGKNSNNINDKSKGGANEKGRKQNDKKQSEGMIQEGKRCNELLGHKRRSPDKEKEFDGEIEESKVSKGK